MAALAVPLAAQQAKETPVAADGLSVSGQPQPVTAEDVKGARRAVALGCDLNKVAPSARIDQWDDVPPMSQDYAASRRVIVEHIRQLLAELDGQR